MFFIANPLTPIIIMIIKPIFIELKMEVTKRIKIGRRNIGRLINIVCRLNACLLPNILLFLDRSIGVLIYAPVSKANCVFIPILYAIAANKGYNSWTSKNKYRKLNALDIRPPITNTRHLDSKYALYFTF